MYEMIVRYQSHVSQMIQLNSTGIEIQFFIVSEVKYNAILNL